MDVQDIGVRHKQTALSRYFSSANRPLYEKKFSRCLTFLHLVLFVFYEIAKYVQLRVCDHKNCSVVATKFAIV